MCQTALIQSNMVRMSRRTYAHRLEVATPNTYRVTQLARLNRDLDALYELIYSQWRTVTAEDYNVLGGQFKLLLETVKGLYDSCHDTISGAGMRDEVKRLGMNYASLYELNADIVNFGIKAPNNDRLKQAFSRLAEVDGKRV